ncbi:MAG: hypothetical protein IJH87_02995 [Atopobiaceae bacterium]|nr:hypothetical protein [Atopobiaceae bacterium]
MTDGRENAPVVPDAQERISSASEHTQIREDASSLAETSQLGERNVPAPEDAPFDQDIYGIETEVFERGPVDARTQGSRFKPLYIVIGLAVAVLVGLAGWFIFTRVLPPALTDERIIREFNAAYVENEELTNSIYASNTRYHMDSGIVLSVSDDRPDAKTARVQMVYSNESFSVTVEATQRFQLADRTWVGMEPTIKKVEAVPIAPVDSARVLADIDTLMSRVTPRGGVSLEVLYTDASFEVESAELSEDGMSCTLVIKADKTSGLNRYAGRLTATFEFVPGKASTDAGSWRLSTVGAEDACWERNLAPVRGTWRGVFESTSTSSFMFGTGLCYAGEDTSVELEVKSFDAASGRATCTLSLLVHDHGAITSDADTTTGDTEVGRVEFTVDLDPETLTGSYHNSSEQYGGDWQVMFLNDAGTWKIQIKSGEGMASGGFLGAVFTDVYVLERF